MGDTRTVKAALEHAGTWHPRADAFVRGADGEALTFAAVNVRANRIANALSGVGVGRGDRVAFLARNTVAHAVAYLSLSKIGAVGAALHAREAPARLRAMLETVDPAALVVDPAHADLLREVDSDGDLVEIVLGYDGAGSLPDFVRPLSERVREASAATPSVEVEPTDPAYVNFTSGSTGEPTGVLHTQGEVIESARLGQYCAGLRVDDVFLNVRSPSFIGWSNWQFSALNAGATTVFLEEWDPDRVVSVVDAHPVTFLVLTPTQWRMVVRAGVGDCDTSSLRLAAYAGEPLNGSLLRTLQEAVTDRVFTIYGSTETMCSGLALYPGSLSPATVDSVGKPLPNVDVRLVEPGSRDPEATVAHGESGELLVRGPSVAETCVNAEDEGHFHPDGWWYSSDLAHVGADGNVRLEGRVDNVIVSGGINVNAEHVEAVLDAHPRVVEAAVVGVPHEEWTEAAKAFVVPDGDIDADALDSWCLESDDLADYKRPREYEFRAALPRTSTTKLDRVALRKGDGEGRESDGDGREGA